MSVLTGSWVLSVWADLDPCDLLCSRNPQQYWSAKTSLSLSLSLYIDTCMSLYIYICMYIYIERERYINTERYIDTYTYVYLYIQGSSLFYWKYKPEISRIVTFPTVKDLLPFAFNNWSFSDVFQSRVGVVIVAKQSLTLATPSTLARQTPLSMGFPRQEYWSGLPFASPGDLPNPGLEPTFPALAGRFPTAEPPGLPKCWCTVHKCLLTQSVH